MNPQINVVIELPDNFIEQVAEKVMQLQDTPTPEYSKPFFNVKEVSKMLEIHPGTLRKHIRDDILSASKPGRSYLITEDEFNTYRNRNRKQNGK